MRVILIPIGSAGDVFPFLAIGRLLKARGHDVVVITNAYFRPLVEQLGFRFREFGAADEFRAVMSDPDLWHPLRGFKTVMRAMHDQSGLFRTIESQLETGCVIAAHTLAFAARVMQEKRGIPLVSLALQPAIFRSLRQGPCFIGARRTSDLPRPLQRLFWWVTDRLLVDPHIAAALDPLRDSLGLPRARRFFRQWIFSPQLTIATFPDWFAPPQPDWPSGTRLAGFPLTDDFGGHVPQALEEILDGGQPPIVFTPGSANIHAREFFAAAAEASHQLGRRAILLTRHPEQLPPSLPAGVSHFDFAPLSQILPRCAALVHHGGIGTTAAGLAAGVPQVIMPLSHDQPDNAARILALGAGLRLPPRLFTPQRLGSALTSLLASPQTHARCQSLAARCAEQDAIATAVAWIEQAAAEPR